LGRFRQQPADATLGLAGALRGVAVERVQPAPGVGVEGEHRRRLGQQGVADSQQYYVLEDIGVVAGVEGMAVVHRDRVSRRWRRRLAYPVDAPPSRHNPAPVMPRITLDDY